MENLKHLEVDNVPHVVNAYMHNGEVIGVTPEGELVILAVLGGNNAKPEVHKRAKRQKKDTSISDVSE